MGEKKQLTGDPRIDHNWFSRRHQSNAEFLEHQSRREAKQQHKTLDVEERTTARAGRSDEEQLAELDRRNEPAKRERARLLARIAAKKPVTEVKAEVAPVVDGTAPKEGRPLNKKLKKSQRRREAKCLAKMAQ